MSESRPFELESGSGRTVRGRIDLPERPGKHPAILICHGFKAFQEWGFYPPLVELLTARGFATARFNFSGAGMRPGDELVTDERAFRAATFSRDVEEAGVVLRALRGELAPDRVDPERIGMLGHSRGGGVAVLAAAAAEERGVELGALVTWAAVATFDRLHPDEKKEWRRSGEIPVVNGRTGQELMIGAEVLDDLESNAAALDIGAAAGRLRTPWLIVHGTDDETVPAAEAIALERSAAGRHDLLLVDGAGHTFGATHPFAAPTPHLIETFNATQTWLRRHFGVSGADRSG